MRFNTNLFNVLVTSLAFLFLFTAFQTTCLTSQNVLEAAARERERQTGNAYWSLSILYASLAALNWIAPIIVLVVGEKYAMFLGSSFYVVYVSVFMEPVDWSLYSVSVLTGFGAAVLWTAQGTFITRCSDETSINRHFSIFWSIFQTSQIWGGLYTYFTMTGITVITRLMRYQLFGVLIVIGVLGWFLFLALQLPEEQFEPSLTIEAFEVEADCEVSSIDYVEDLEAEEQEDFQVGRSKDVQSLWKSSGKALVRSFQLIQTKQMVCILVVSGFTGVIATFHLTLLSTCIGHTLAFGDNAKAYIGLVGVFIGSGEFTGGTLMHLRRWISSPGLVSGFGFSSSILAAILLFIILPEDSPIMDTNTPSIVPTSIELCMFAAFLLGVCGSVWNTQICALIGTIYGSNRIDVPVAFALYKCLQALLTAVACAYSGALKLQWQILIFVIFTCASLISFLYAYLKHEQTMKHDFGGKSNHHG